MMVCLWEKRWRGVMAARKPRNVIVCISVGAVGDWCVRLALVQIGWGTMSACGVCSGNGRVRSCLNLLLMTVDRRKEERAMGNTLTGYVSHVQAASLWAGLPFCAVVLLVNGSSLYLVAFGSVALELQTDALPRRV